ncbi:sigma 54-interacting transcriptional regulator [Clostridium swellfunianum]|uniref:sigma 54-interacting transcriptional regulator n=1 Tax=Clostridium swellfunianum TaxID=1367462 RepID=UPI00202F1AD8|nr:sigma-54-dependent transcriptional regulator [Clostridium swellfunianum]MCM0649596.1 sigma 54-interacting transcriptional regulator [Clostridium swellfunianum]
MKRIELVYEKLKELDNGSGVSALELAEALGISRANASSDLNRLCEEGKASKSNGRPVLFKITEEGLAEKERESTTIDKFAAKNQSLFSAVEQAKAAILYPPKGMHILILGDTGVGKSMFAGLIHKYAIEMEKLRKEAPFVTFNCADYANNPQLLISQLFGTKKGAYTGADSDKQGLIEKANGGILFLDEVHRLPPEGQEMFFTFMDKGIYRRLGETEQERKASVIIISATTENPDSALLRTFTRRIPMIIRIPSLSERSLEERFHLISSFFREESSRLDREIMVSVNSMRALLSYGCSNNIGQLKTDIQLVCAKAYADFIAHRKNGITITSSELPSYIREGLYRETEHRQIWNKLIGINKRYCIFDNSSDEILFEEEQKEENIYEMIDIRFHELKGKGINGSQLEQEMEKDIDDYFTKYLYTVNRRIDITNLENLISHEIVDVVQEIISFSEDRLKKNLSQKVYYGMAVHIANSIERIKRNKKIINPQLNKIRTEHPEEFSAALDCLKIIERCLDITIPIDEAGFLAMFLVYDDRERIEEQEEVKVIVIAHGDTTAASMAEVSNKLLGIKHVMGINAPLEEKPQQVLSRLKTMVKENTITSDILLLVDMGSLTTFGEELEKEFNINTRTIPLVSTLHVLEAARKSMLGYSLEQVYMETMNVNRFIEHEGEKEELEESVKNKMAIITICTTGEGSARTIKEFLEAELQFDRSILEIIPLNIVAKENISTRLRAISRDKTVLCLVSSFNISSKLPKFGLHEVLSRKAIEQIQKLIDIETTYIKMGDTLKYQLKNIDGAEVFKDIKEFITQVEEDLNIKMDTDILIGTALHMGCMIDRLKAGGAIIEFENCKEYIKQNPELYRVVKNACSQLNKKYGVYILEDEICYIMSYFDIKKYS